MPLRSPIGFANDTSFITQIAQLLSPPEPEVVGVVIPHYCRERELALCLEALTYQTYSPRFLEVVIADDGTPSDLDFVMREYGDRFFSTTLVRQPDLGFRLSAVRNLGIDAVNVASRVIVLDCDIIPCPELVASHMCALRVSDNIISVGFRQDSCTVRSMHDVLSTRPQMSDLDWRIKHIGGASAETLPRPWLLCSGGNIGFSKRLHTLERFDESFTFWGGEDNEWAYRLYLRGVYFHFNTDAVGLHAQLTPINYNKAEQRAQGKARLAQRCPSYLPDSPSDTPLISFWVTNFGKNAYVADALRSLSGCRFSYEIVIVDNHPAERTPAHLTQLPFTRTVYEPTVGAFYAYERALSECRGEFLVQLDADDTLDIEFVNDAVRLLLTEPHGLAYGLNRNVDINGHPTDTPVWIPKQRSRFENILCGMHIRSPRIIRKRDLARAPIRAPLQAAVDFGLYSKILLVTEPLCIERVAYNYRQTPGAVSDIRKAEQVRDTFRVIEHNRSLLLGSADLQEAHRGPRSVAYAEPIPDMVYINHLALAPDAARVFLHSVLKHSTQPDA